MPTVFVGVSDMTPAFKTLCEVWFQQKDLHVGKLSQAESTSKAFIKQIVDITEALKTWGCKKCAYITDTAQAVDPTTEANIKNIESFVVQDGNWKSVAARLISVKDNMPATIRDMIDEVKEKTVVASADVRESSIVLGQVAFTSAVYQLELKAKSGLPGPSPDTLKKPLHYWSSKLNIPLEALPQKLRDKFEHRKVVRPEKVAPSSGGASSSNADVSAEPVVASKKKAAEAGGKAMKKIKFRSKKD